MAFPPTRISLRILARSGINRATAQAWGGIISGGGNVTYTEDTEGFKRVADLKVIRPPVAIKERELGNSSCNMKKRGPKLWKIFHEWTLTSQPKPEVWLDNFQKQIRCPDCVAEFITIRKDIPFVPGFEWGYQVHDRINIKLNKPRPTLEQALVVYPKPQTPDPKPPQ